MLPMLLHLKVHGGTTSFGFYIPLGLVYLLLVPILILGAVAILVLLMIPETSKLTRSYLPLIRALPTLLSASIGTEIEVKSDKKDILIHIT
ncbi:MAG: hypothetical protein ACQ5SW_05925 [Sphaerochaetaceae bacterium]